METAMGTLSETNATYSCHPFSLPCLRASFLSIVALLSCFVFSAVPQSTEVAAETRLPTLSVVGAIDFRLVTNCVRHLVVSCTYRRCSRSKK